MTPIEKAKEIVDKIYFDIDYDLVGMPNTKKMVSKQCALIAVDEMINEIKEFDDEFGFSESRLNYWQGVKEEIEKL